MRQAGIVFLIVAAAALLLWPVNSQAAQEPTIAVERETAEPTGIVIQSPTPEPAVDVPTETATAILVESPTPELPTETATATETATPEPPAPLAPEATVTVTPPILNTVDQHLAQLWPIAKNKQDNYYATHGHYFQGLLTHSSLPADGLPAALDNALAHPTDQQDSWATFLEAQLPATMVYALRVDVYSGPAGEGWVATLYLLINGQVWSRAGAVGPEAAQRVYDWRIVDIP